MGTGAARARVAGLVGALLMIASCKSSLDSVGCTERGLTPDGGGDAAPAIALAPLSGPASYPNAFRDVLGKTEAEIAAKIDGVFEQLFHGDPDTQAIFVPLGTDQAYVLDALHDQRPTEGIGLGMLITVSLGKRDEFDRLWRYARSIQVASGPAEGYLPSFCETSGDELPCFDPYGLQQIATALLLARGRWEAKPGPIDYGREAATLLDLLRNKEAYNCGVADGITGTFDGASALPYATPTSASAGVSRPSIVMPAYYELWHQATGDPFWLRAASAARAYWKAAAHPTTGLLPEQATFDGEPVPDAGTFRSETHRAFFNMALDCIWSGSQPWLVDESNRLLQFFHEKGLTSYGLVFALDGTTLRTIHGRSLTAANGALALAATTALRRDFVSEVWNMGAPSTGQDRYYPGITQLLALLMLGGQLRVY